MRSSSAVILFSILVAPALAIYAADSAPMAAKGGKGGHQNRAAGASFENSVLPLMTRYCGGCHGEKTQVAGISFHTFKDEASVVKGRRTWEKVAEAVKTGHMPPKNAVPLPAKDRALLTGWIETKLASAGCDLRDSGRVTLRRLNRAEYNNTIRDLVGIDFRPADDFPSDDVGYGFDNIGDVLTISPLLMEKYLNAAEQITERAIAANSYNAPAERVHAKDLADAAGGQFHENTFRILGQTGDSLRRAFTFSKDGEYVLRVRAFGQQFGDEPPKMAVRLDGGDRFNPMSTEVALLEVKATEDSPHVYEARAKVTAGRRRFSVTYTNNFKDLENPDPAKRGDRNLLVEWIEVIGPVADEAKPIPESHKRLFVVQPEEGKEREAARLIVERFATRAFRRPVRAEELDRILKIWEMSQTDGESFERGIQLAVQAVLVSPHFLFRVELDDPKAAAAPGASAAGQPINDWELASRLSYFLWASMPDEELMQLAAAGRLAQPEVLEAQAKRMLRDPKSRAVVENFADQWLNLRLLKNVNPDPKRYPAFNDALRQAMVNETQLFFESIMREDRPVTDLLDARYTFLNERLATHYGIEWVKGDHFRKVVLPDERRGGILTHASVLTLTSNPTRTSPVKRGKWVLEQVLGTPPPPAPPDVPALAEDTAEMMVKGTLKQRMEQHRRDPACATCHLSMDAMGFALENFDPIGAWREKDGEEPIDASGALKTGEKVDGIGGLKKILRKQKGEFVRNFSEQLLTYALGRGLEHYDDCVVNDITQRTARQRYSFSSFVTEIVKSDPFRKRRGEGEVQ